VLPPVLIVVVAVGFVVALTFVLERTWSCPWAAIASDPVNIAPVTKLNSWSFVFISLFFGSKD
jgi:hypothetical protein